MTDIIATVEETALPVSEPVDQEKSLSGAMTEEQKELQKWQNQMLRLMQAILVFVTVLFFVSGWIQLRFLQSSILQESPASVSIEEILADSEAGLEATAVEAAIYLENFVVERRYHQANTMLMTMAWIRYLGFSTGMVIALVGAAFILGKLRVDSFNLDVKDGERTFSLGGTSPGLIMVVLGVTLMLTTIVRQQSFDLIDQPTYFNISGVVDPQQAATSTPPTLPTFDPEE